MLFCHPLFSCLLNKMAESNEWSREKIKKVLDVLKEMKDFDRVPLPMNIHKEFDIPLNKPRNMNVMDYFQRYMDIQSMPVDKTEVIDGSVLYKDVVFPTSILEPPKNMYKELQLDDGVEPHVIVHEEKKEEEEEKEDHTEIPELVKDEISS